MYYRKIIKKLFQVKIKFKTFINKKIILNGSEVGFLTSNDKKNGLAYISKNILENIEMRAFSQVIQYC